MAHDFIAKGCIEMTKTSREAFEEWARDQFKGIDALFQNADENHTYFYHHVQKCFETWLHRDAEVAELRQQLQEQAIAALDELARVEGQRNAGNREIERLLDQLAAAQADANELKK